MSFRFKRQESVRDGFHRIAAGELDAVQTLLDAVAATSQREEAVHEARRHLKKLRALLRLLRKPLGKQLAKDQIRCLGEIADRLAPARDARVLLAAVDAVGKGAGPAGSAAVSRLRRSYAAQLRRTERDSLDAQAVTDLKEALAATKAAITGPTFEDDEWQLLAPGVQRMFRRMRKAYCGAETEGGTTAFHEWRKRCKDMQYQLRLFEPVCPKAMKQLDRRLDRLNQILGEDHDLAMLEQSLRDQSAAFLRSEPARLLLKTIAARRHKLQRRALRQGGKLVAGHPRDSARQLHRQWKDWRKD